MLKICERLQTDSSNKDVHDVELVEGMSRKTVTADQAPPTPQK